MRGRAFVVLVGLAVIAAVALVGGAAFGGSSHHQVLRVSKFATDPDNSAKATAGLGPALNYDAYLNAADAYPANTVTPGEVNKAEATFDAIAKGGDPQGGGKNWEQVGPTDNANVPGVTSFSGASYTTGSRITALVVDPNCKARGSCRVWAGAAGGGVWKTDNALDDNPDWKQVKPEKLDQNSVGVLTLAPSGKDKNTLYLGTGEPNRCSSGCEAGVGIYVSKNGGDDWNQLSALCVDNLTYKCVTPGVNAFLGRGISAIVVDPNNSNHLYVGSAQAVRGLSHVIGAGGTTRLEPGANQAGLYESTDGGQTFTEVWNGNVNGSFGVTDVGLDPQNPNTVYASAFDQGLWRRDAGAGQFAFSQVFAPQFPGGGTDKTMFALTVKNGKTRAYLTEGTANGGGVNTANQSNFWRIDNVNQPASTLLSNQVLPCTPPNPATNTFPATYNAWTCLTAGVTSSPYYATADFCTGQCWYDEDVYTPAGMPDTVYVIGSFEYGELPCNTKGVGCGNGRSNGRAVLYSDTAGDPDSKAPGAGVNRTFTDLTYDAQNVPANWCGLGSAELDFGGVQPAYQCAWAANAIHPDQHAIVVNPANPTQIFEGSDGGVIRTTGTFSDLSARCNSNERPLLGAASLANCGRLLSRVPTELDHINKKYSSTLQFIDVAINPSSDCDVTGGTQDNGTWTNTNYSSKGPDCDNKSFSQIIYGDGGNSGYDGANPTWRFNQFTSAFSDSNFKNGDPTKWVISSAPVVNSGEAVGFYFPEVGDPNPVSGAHPIYIGAQSVWRTWAFGAGHAGNVPQDKTPDIAGYEANCPEFTTGGSQDGCGDYRPLGGPYCDGLSSTTTILSCANQPNDLTGTSYGSDRSGGAISWIARDSADHGTIWVATGAGRIFVTHNADAGDPATVVWNRIDNSTVGASPTRYPSGIYTDPKDPNHAWISYSGYNAVTPGTPGHVFDVKWSGVHNDPATFTNLHVENGGTSSFPTPFSDGDLPVADVARDDSSGTLYAATDFGVLAGYLNKNGTYDWYVTKGMPRYEIMHLEIQPSSRVPTCMSGKKCKPVLYAATHSQGIWKLSLNGNGNGNGNNDDHDGHGGHGGHH